MADDNQLQGAAIEALDAIKDPKTNQPLLDTHLVEKVEVSDGEVTVHLKDPEDRSKQDRWALEDLIADALEAVDGVKDVYIQTFTEGGPKVPEAGPAPAAPASAKPKPQMPSRNTGSVPAQQQIAGVKAVIAVASGKGGVGKSTVAVNLALALKSLGYNTGLLDVDIYGPSLPTLLGIEGRPKVKDRKIMPLKAHGLNIMSLGFLMEDDAPVIWRGPIVTGIIRQFLQDVDWRGTDYLVIDLPPGTGDAQLTLAQSVPIDGAVVVTTPSDLALIDAARGLQMFRTLNVEVLGIVENMSYFVCDGCDKKHYIFGEGGGAKEAARLGLPLLGQVPLDPRAREAGDTGKPIVALDPDSPTSKAFIDLAKKVAEEAPAGEAEASPKKKGLFSFIRS
ncbi:MAG: Mrp/NBP35 family ATP-binding protein [Myxococcales bacterium]|nr:Mrp/NBP35 family ATP-binding protein [Myxococcales bacterium]